jgi:curved DNA-binding protein CbpA
MDLNKDYYAILGIVSSADEETIKAVYRLLSKKYHPDTTKEESEEAAQKIRDINEAYAVLSDKTLRKKYDKERKHNNSSHESYYEEETTNEDDYADLDSDWGKAVSYYPVLNERREQLGKFSRDLADTFRLYILTEKKYSNFEEIADILESIFLQRFFGTHEKIHDFAKLLLLGGNRQLAKQLNKDIKFFGNDIESANFLKSFCSQHSFETEDKKQKTEDTTLNKAEKAEAIQLINAIFNLDISPGTKEELLGYLDDLTSDDFLNQDLIYLRALYLRLPK